MSMRESSELHGSLLVREIFTDSSFREARPAQPCLSQPVAEVLLVAHQSGLHQHCRGRIHRQSKEEQSRAKAAAHCTSSHMVQLASTRHMLVLLPPHGFMRLGSSAGQIGKTCGPCYCRAALRPPKPLLPDTT
jgi:hypothetical protein